MKNKLLILFLSLLMSTLLLAGFVPAAFAEGGEVSGIVWVDKDADGVNNGERGFNAVKITLQKMLPDGSYESIVSTWTEKNGSYAFAVAEDGEYRLHFVLPKDYRFTRHGLESSVLPAQGNESYTLPFAVSGGQAVTVNAGGLSGNSYVSIIAFEDLNLNGGRRESEPRVRNVQVQLYYDYNGTAHLIAETDTNKNGENSISHLSPGTYYIKAVLPDSFVAGPLGEKISSFYNCMQPSTDEVCYSLPFELPQKGGVSIGIGMVTTGSLSGQVWLDANGNQQKDAGEENFSDVTVTVHSAELNITRTAAVAADGSFSFTGLQPAIYNLIYTLPEGHIFAEGNDSALHDIAREAVQPVTIIAKQHTAVRPVGAAAASKVNVSVYETDDEQVLPLSQVQGTLVQNGKEICTAVSDANGLMHFPIARAGNATVQIILPEGYVVAQDGGAFPYVNCSTAPSFDLAVPLADTASADGFAVKAASISGRLVEDPTNTGILSESNRPLAGYTVQAIDGNDQAVQQAITDLDGFYTLPNLVPGTYYVRFLLDDRYIATPCMSEEDSAHNAICTQEPSFGETDALVLYPGQNKSSVNGALFKAGIVDGYVLLNPAYDGLATNNGGAQNITVTLLDEQGDPWQDYAYDITDENGYFCIKGILPGTFMLQYTLDENSTFVLPDTKAASFTSQNFVIENGSEIHADPIATVYTATLAGSVTDYTSEAGVSARMTLTNQRTNEVFTVNTDADGAYAFTHLLPDQYQLDVELADGYLFADSSKSVLPYLNESASSAMVTIPMGVSEENCNIIASLPVSWNVQLYLDANGNDSRDQDEPAAAGRSAELYLREDLIGQYTADDNGILHFENIIPASYTLKLPLSDNEILVAAPDADTVMVDRDGLSVAILPYAAIEGQVWSMDGTSNGVDGLEISLVQNGQVVMTAITDENGNYAFEKLLKGDYQLRARLNTGYSFARMQDVSARNSYILSQVDGSSIYGMIPLQMGQTFAGADIGIGAMGSIGDIAWIDLNKNGMQDIGETPLPGVKIELYQYGNLAASATTDMYGRYHLDNLYPGTYEMHVTMPKEVKPTIRQDQFPLVASILPESGDTTVVVENVIVPSNAKDLNMDLGFVLKKKNVYPASIKEVPQKDWSSYPHPED